MKEVTSQPIDLEAVEARVIPAAELDGIEVRSAKAHTEQAGHATRRLVATARDVAPLAARARHLEEQSAQRLRERQFCAAQTVRASDLAREFEARAEAAEAETSTLREALDEALVGWIEAGAAPGSYPAVDAAIARLRALLPPAAKEGP